MTQSFFKVLLHQNVFIYLETDYLKRFYFSALFCTVSFCHDHEMIDPLNYYCCNNNNHMMYFVIFNFFPHFKNNFVITIICYEMLFRTILAPTVLAVSLDR